MIREGPGRTKVSVKCTHTTALWNEQMYFLRSYDIIGTHLGIQERPGGCNVDVRLRGARRFR